jgi:hypothetical protein
VDVCLGSNIRCALNAAKGEVADIRPNLSGENSGKSISSVGNPTRGNAIASTAVKGGIQSTERFELGLARVTIAGSKSRGNAGDAALNSIEIIVTKVVVVSEQHMKQFQCSRFIIACF